MKFTQTLLKSIEDIYNSILNHSFIKGLTDGTIEESAFQHYAIQDALYLRDFAKGLAIIATKAEDDNEFLLFCSHASNAILVERSLHESFFKTWNLSSEQIYQTKQAPNTLLYTSFLLRIASTRPYHESIGAFLPCYWIYLLVGKKLLEKGSPNPIYQKWISTYGGDEFEEVVNQVLKLTDQLSENLTNGQKEKVKENFILTSKMEYYFWDMGYQKQNWLV
jgi:thiaminase/transcriptional activator TenA